MIYFDSAATTKPCRESIDAMTEAFTRIWGNPSSRHRLGTEARSALEGARADILKTLGARGRAAGDASHPALIFTGSGTEATNMAILGVCRSKRRRGRIIISGGEHSATENAAVEAAAEGFEVVKIPTARGVLDMEALAEALTPDTVLLSLMMVNNETGAVYDVGRAFAEAKRRVPDIVCHCDAVQGYMKIPFSVLSLGADLVTISAHKINGPCGIGALYVGGDIYKRRQLSPIIFGGGQESGLRSGTEDVAEALGFAAAAKRAYAVLTDEAKVTDELRRYIISEAEEKMPSVTVNLPERSAPHIISLTLHDIKSETMLNYLSGRGICVSSGSACSSHSRNISRALTAFGISERDADTTIRVSIWADNTRAEADELIRALSDGIKTLSRIGGRR
ncbi:MAG: aminotransferase class V-fold PLP-dependent enzyme [Firmicutes bacterium]|nr:aminotransferase class V-fold PLP-dependent enzyme [Bacillota bacterium]